MNNDDYQTVIDLIGQAGRPLQKQIDELKDECSELRQRIAQVEGNHYRQRPLTDPHLEGDPTQTVELPANWREQVGR